MHVLLLQWPPVLKARSPVASNMPGMVLDRYNAVQKGCFCGVFPEINTLSAEHHDWRRARLLSPRLQVARLSDEGARRTALVRSKIEREVSSAGSDREPWLR